MMRSPLRPGLALIGPLVAVMLLIPAAGSAAARPTHVSLTVPGKVAAGAWAPATGKASPPGGRIALRVEYRGAWRVLGSAGVRAGGGYRLVFRVPTGAGSELRLRATLSLRGRVVGRSAVRRVRVEAAAIAPAPDKAPAGPPAPSGTTVGANVPPAESPPAEGGETGSGEEESPPPGEEPAPPADAYWGAWIGRQLTGEAAPWDMTAVTKFEEMVGKAPSLIEFSAPFQECSGATCAFSRFPTTPFNSIRAYGAIPFFSWGSESAAGGATKEEFQLKDIIEGDYDSYIREFATRAKEWAHPFFLRFDWEMNGDWFTWGEGTNGNQPGEFVAAWKHVHDIFTSVGATNASWVWCPYVNHLNLYASLYPGDSYVDWTCLDGYNWGTHTGHDYGWKTFDELYGPAYAKIVKSIAPSKPMVLGEVSSSEEGGSKALWIEEMAQALAARYPLVRGLIWFENEANDMDWPLESSPTAVASFATQIAAARFRANEFGSLASSPIPPP